MKTKDLENINHVLAELWDFFTSNCDGDETNLVNSISSQYIDARNSVRNELSKNWVRNEVQKLVKKGKEVKP